MAGARRRACSAKPPTTRSTPRPTASPHWSVSTRGRRHRSPRSRRCATPRRWSSSWTRSTGRADPGRSRTGGRVCTRHCISRARRHPRGSRATSAGSAREADAETGLWRRDAVPRGETSPPAALPAPRGTFHYLFNCEHAGVAPPHPAALAETCERIQAAHVYPLARFVSFAEVDWVYCLHRAARHCDRVDAVRPGAARVRGRLSRLPRLDSIPTRTRASTTCTRSSAPCRRSPSCRMRCRARSRANGRCGWCSTGARSSETFGRGRGALPIRAMKRAKGPAIDRCSS